MLSKRDWEARRALVGGMLLSPGFGALLKSPNKNFFNGSFIKQQVDEAGLFDIYILGLQQMTIQITGRLELTQIIQNLIAMMRENY